jgi:release factor glutamine methyltransferase
MGLQFAVDKRVFIPRPETETLVEQVMMKSNQRREGEGINILEIGTGSGNVAVSIAKLVRNARVVSIDKSEEALQVANANAAVHGVSGITTFVNVDFLEPLDERFTQQFNFLVSNPPYVSIQEWLELEPEVNRFEPKRAVSDQSDGYEFYRRISSVARQLLQSEGWVIVEVGHGQSDQVCEMFRANSMTEVSVVDDLQEIPRVVLAKCP